MDIITYALCKKADKEIIDMIHEMEGMTVEIVDEVPTVQEAQYNIMYLVDTNGDGKYEAYIKAKISGVDQIISLGSIIDLSDFYTKSEIDIALAGKQPLLTWDNVPTSDSSNAISSGAIYTALDKIKIEEMSDAEYAALATKDPDKLYLVQGTEDNKRVVIGYDANDNPVYRMELYGCVASATWGDNVTVAPQLIEPDNQAAGCYAIKTTIYGANDSTRYHANNLITGPAPGTDVTLTNNSSYVTDSTGTNLWFKVHTNNIYLNLMKGENSSWISNIRLNGYNVSKFGYEKIPTNIRYIYKNNKLYATINANDIVYDNSTSGLTATNVKVAIDELNANITPHTELTQAQYDALVDPDDNTEYFITDSEAEGDFSNFETRMSRIEQEFIVYYRNGNQRIPLYTENIKKVIKIDNNTVDWYIDDPDTGKHYKATVTAEGQGNVRTNPQISVVEVV